MIHNIPQPAFEEFVAAKLVNDSNVEIRKNVAYVSSKQASLVSICLGHEDPLMAKQTGDSVISTLIERSTKTQWQVKSSHVLACDGAKSQVRQDLGIESEGDDGCMESLTL